MATAPVATFRPAMRSPMDRASILDPLSSRHALDLALSRLLIHSKTNKQRPDPLGSAAESRMNMPRLSKKRAVYLILINYSVQ